MMTNAPVDTKNKSVQTRIRCYPTAPENISGNIKVVSDRSVQTTATTPPDTINIHFYTLLEYIPYPSIADDFIRELDLPRKAFLQWKPPTFFDDQRSNTLIYDEIESSSFRGVLKKDSVFSDKFIYGRSIAHRYKMKVELVTQDVQTDIRVAPHVLDSDELAKVFTEISIQTSITCDPERSNSKLVPLLRANLKHDPNFSASETQSIESMPTELGAEENGTFQVTSEDQNQVDFTSNQVNDFNLDNGLSEAAAAPMDEEYTTENPLNISPEADHSRNDTTNTISGCQCSANLFNAIQGKLKVKISMLQQLTPQVFPSNASFEEQMMQLLVKTVTILQKEMIDIITVLLSEDICTVAPCSKPVRDTFVQESTKNVYDDPRSCKCSPPTNKAVDFEARKCITAQSCGSSNDGHTLATPTNEHREIIESSVLRKYVDPTTNELKIVKEDFVEETVRWTVSNTNNETVIEERVRRTKLRGVPMQPCICPTNNKTLEVAGEKQTVVVSEINEDVTQDKIGEEIEQLENVANQSEMEEASPDEQTTEHAHNDIPTQDTNTPHHIEEPSTEAQELIGDFIGVKKYDNIECECHPREAGAAPPFLHLHDALLPAFIPCTCSSRNDVAEMHQPNRAAGVRTSYSCPESSIVSNVDVKAGPSIPNITEQVIRLSMVLKQGPTEPEIRTEELLTPGRQITFAPNRLADSQLAPMCLQFEQVGQELKLLCECNELVCAKTAKTDINNSLCNSKQGPKREQLPTQHCPECPVHGGKPSSIKPPYASTQPGMPTNTDIVITIAYDVSNGAHSEQELNKRSSTLMYEHDAIYAEPYFDEINNDYAIDATPNAQIDTSVEDKFEPQSSMLKGNELVIQCDSRTEMPWEKISLPAQGTYKIQSIKGEDKVIKATEYKAVAPEPDEIMPEGPELEQVSEIMSNESEKVSETMPEDLEQEQIGEIMSEGPEQEQEQAAVTELALEPKSAPESEPEPEQTTLMLEEPAAKGGPKSRESHQDKQLFQSDIFKVNEPYMEGLYRAFIDTDEEESSECGSGTEIPWNTIILPKNCKIRTIKKPKKCTCKIVSSTQEHSGMLIPKHNVPTFFQDIDMSAFPNINTASSISQQSIHTSDVNVYVGMDEYPSTVMHVGVNNTDDDNVSLFSTISTLRRKAKRTNKNIMLVIDYDDDNTYSISFQGTQAGQTLQIEGAPLHASASEPFHVTRDETGEDENLFIINIISKSEPTQSNFDNQISNEITNFVPPTAPFDIQNFTEQQNYLGETRTSAAKSLGYVKSPDTSGRDADSTGGQLVQTKVLIKREGDPDKVITEQMQLKPGDNTMNLKVPGEDINIKLKMSTPELQDASESTSKKCVCKTGSKPTVKPKSPQSLKTTSGVCICKDKSTPDAYAQDPVIAALESYEAEMRPLKQELYKLQEKIRNLNMPEMKDLCSHAVTSSPPPSSQQQWQYPPMSVSSKIRISRQPGGVVQTTRHLKFPQKPSTNGGQSNHPYLQGNAFREPAYPASPYGQLPTPVLGQPFQSYMPIAPYYEPPVLDPSQYYCCSSRSPMGPYHEGSRSQMQSQRMHSSRRHKGSSKQDIAYQANNYAIYPDYRGRNYPNEEMVHKHSNIKKSHRQRKDSSRSGSDYSQGGSDGEDLRPRKEYTFQVKQKHSNSRTRKHKETLHKTDRKPSKSNICAPCTSSRGSQHIRPGKALKTSPDDFLPEFVTDKRSHNKRHTSSPTCCAASKSKTKSKNCCA